MIPSNGRPPRRRRASELPPPKRGCCAMVEAVRSVRRGKYRLARRYTAMSVRLLVG